MSFLAPTPLSTGSAAGDAVLWTAVVIAPLTCVPDMGHLGKFSACGIAAVLATFVVIFWYGLVESGLGGFGMIAWGDLWPKGGIDGLSKWFGICAFSYGTVPITYNIQEGMRDPSQMSRATQIALVLVYIVYVIISDGVAIVYRPATGPDGFEGDVLQELPVGWIPTAIRMAMTFVVLVTAPLLAVPCAQLVEGKLGIDTDPKNSVVVFEEGDARSFVQRHPNASSVAVRYAICLLCAGISILVPGFVDVLSFVGAFCVALTSFVFPPLLHITLLRRKLAEEEVRATRSVSAPVFKPDAATEKELRRFGSPQVGEKKRANPMTADSLRIIRIDAALLIWGVVATAITSLLTFLDLFR
eukprot:CAMPEP_0113528766 /NCGR_PEP_ID=MMETSP0015_2-20120614/2023_1 /TAXON_ID=2838 /ORGANISM="Odontella" /LENGTH=356 /DNA_ID=CAMNT_0000427327 /DNA_START=29 /DNA_END=1099 /DNA_ORIENTATION=- /assembly_acc=CAM_ASM_000160